jgi:hypothetical protein
MPKKKLKNGICGECDPENAKCFFCNTRKKVRRLKSLKFGVVWSCGSWNCKTKGDEWI